MRAAERRNRGNIISVPGAPTGIVAVTMAADFRFSQFPAPPILWTFVAEQDSGCARFFRARTQLSLGIDGPNRRQHAHHIITAPGATRMPSRVELSLELLEREP